MPAEATGTPVTPLPGGTINIGSGWASTEIRDSIFGGDLFVPCGSSVVLETHRGRVARVRVCPGTTGAATTPGTTEKPTQPPGSPKPVEKAETTTKINPDGSTTTTRTHPDGRTTTTTVLTYQDGRTTTTTTNPDGSTITTRRYPDGSTITTTTRTNPDGSTTSTLTYPDGYTTTFTTLLDGSTTATNRDGSTTTYYPDGSWVVHRDGKITSSSHEAPKKTGAAPGKTGAATTPGTTEKTTQPPGSPKLEKPVLNIKLVTLGGPLDNPVIHLDPGPATTPEEFVQPPLIDKPQLITGSPPAIPEQKITRRPPATTSEQPLQPPLIDKPQQQITGTPPLIPEEKIETTTRTDPDAPSMESPIFLGSTTWDGAPYFTAQSDDRRGYIEVSVPVDNREQTNVGIPPGQDAKEAAKALGGMILATGPQGAIINTVGDPKTIEKKAQEIGLKTDFVEKNYCTIMTPLTPFRGHDHKAHEQSGRGVHDHDAPDPGPDWRITPPEIVIRLE